MITFEELKRQAEKGDAKAQNSLAVRYEQGDGGVKDNLAEALKWLKKSAEQGYNYAQYNLGLCYFYGKGVAVDFNESLKWYKLAEKNGHKMAAYSVKYVQQCIDEGSKKSKEEYDKWLEELFQEEELYAEEEYVLAVDNGATAEFLELKKKAEAGDAKAQNTLAIRYEKGDGVEKNMLEAVKWYNKSAEQGNKFAQYNLGLCYQHAKGVEKDYSKALEWFKKAESQGHEKSKEKVKEIQKLLDEQKKTVVEEEIEEEYVEDQQGKEFFEEGLNYYNGNGVKKDYKQAFDKFEMATWFENRNAQYYLGQCYKYGRGVEYNKWLAFKWYKKAAEQGHKDAQYALGECYSIGSGVERNDTESFKWYKKAAEQGVGRAQYSVGWRYELGLGVSQDYNEALKWYKKAESQGNENAIVRVFHVQKHLGGQKNIDAQEQEKRRYYSKKWFEEGLKYYNGNGVTKDYKRAFQEFEMATVLDNKDAQYYMGRCYHYGLGVQQNYTYAFEWYKKAAEQGHKDAQRELGNFYCWGNGVEKNLSEAVKWYKKAAEQGNVDLYSSIGYYYATQDEIKDFNEAIKYYMLAFKNGDFEAYFRLGEYYEEGKYVAQNYNEAIKYYDTCIKACSENLSNKDAKSAMVESYFALSRCQFFVGKEVEGKRNYFLAKMKAREFNLIGDWDCPTVISEGKYRDLKALYE